MAKSISLLIYHDEKRFEVFESPFEAQKKWEELAGIKDLPMGEWLRHSVPVSIEHKELKNYYGTVWIAYKFKDNGVCWFEVKGRWKDEIFPLITKSLKITKYVLEVI